MSGKTTDEAVRYTWKARTPTGKIDSGVLRAARKVDVTRELLAGGLVPLEVKKVGALSLDTNFEVRKSAKPRALAATMLSLAQMLNAGLPYLESIEIARGGCDDTVLANALGEVHHAIQGGSSFSAALATQDQVFPPVVINLVLAGEESGDLKGTMLRVAETLDAADALRSKVKKAMTYPAVVAVVAAAVFVFMMTYIVPKFTSTYADLGGPDAHLPLLTQMVVTVSRAMIWAVPLLLVATVPSIVWYRKHRHDERVREVVDPLKLKLPVFGRLFHNIALERFARDLGGLLAAGVERLEALTIASGTCGNIAMERAILAAREAQRRGRPLVEPLRAEPLFPAALIQMIEAGERSGSTDTMLLEASRIHHRIVDEIAESLAALIEPIFIVVLGVMVAVLVIAIYLPYFHIGDVIS